MPYIKSYKRSWMTDERMLKNHLLPEFGNMAINTITTEHISRFIQIKRETLSPSFCNRLIMIIRYCYNLALNKYKIPKIKENPAKEVSLLPDPFGKRERYLSKAETTMLIEHINLEGSNTLKHIVSFLILTGARKREALDAKWQDFDIDRRIWTIPICKLGRPRRVPISDVVIKLLQLIPRISDYVFANPKTLKPYVGIFNAWNKARKGAGLDNLKFHDLRHSFASFFD